MINESLQSNQRVESTVLVPAPTPAFGILETDLAST